MDIHFPYRITKPNFWLQKRQEENVLVSPQIILESYNIVLKECFRTNEYPLAFEALNDTRFQLPQSKIICRSLNKELEKELESQFESFVVCSYFEFKSARVQSTA